MTTADELTAALTTAFEHLRGIEWEWDPDPSDSTHVVEYSFLLREGSTVRSLHEQHVFGLFTRDTWIERLEGCGFIVDTTPRPIGNGEFDEVFVCRRP